MTTPRRVPTHICRWRRTRKSITGSSTVNSRHTSSIPVTIPLKASRIIKRESNQSSRLMILLAFSGIVTGILLVWRELTVDDPVIDFRVLRHRQMWVGTLLGVVMGVGLY